MSGAPGGDAVRIAVAQPLISSDPIKATTNFLGGIQEEVFENLTRIDAKTYEVKPLLATKWSVADNHLEWTFTLRKGVKFTDGTPFNAQAVVANWKRIFNPKNTVPLRDSAGPVSAAKAIDDYTVKLTTSRPYSALPASLSGEYWSMVSPHSIEMWGEDLSSHRAAGTGPYMIKSFSAPDDLVLVRNPDYWGAAARTAQLSFHSQEDSNGRLSSLLADQIDVDMYLDANQVSTVKNNDNSKLVTIPSGRMFMLHIPMGLKPFQDIRVRHAMNLVIDREQIIETVYKGLATKAQSSVAPSIGYEPLGELTYDPQKASSLLQQAGWKKNSDGVLAKDGSLFPTMRFEASDSNYPNDTQLAQAVAGYLTEAGFPIELKLEPFDTFFPSASKNAADGNWLTQMAWASPSFDAANFLNQMYSTATIKNGGHNWGGYSDPAFDKLNKDVGAAFGADRTAAVTKAAQYLWDRYAAVWLVVPGLLVGTGSDVSGLQLAPSEYHVYSQVGIAE